MSILVFGLDERGAKGAVKSKAAKAAKVQLKAKKPVNVTQGLSAPPWIG